MENEYGITVTNKYSLFLSGDEDLLQVLQRELESKPTSKKEKQKKASGKEKEAKVSQSNLSGNDQPKVESVDQFTSPTSGDGMYYVLDNYRFRFGRVRVGVRDRVRVRYN